MLKLPLYEGFEAVNENAARTMNVVFALDVTGVGTETVDTTVEVGVTGVGTIDEVENGKTGEHRRADAL
jgi:hypothetical protein